MMGVAPPTRVCGPMMGVAPPTRGCGPMMGVAPPVVILHCPPRHRIPRVTTAHWRLAGGGVACLTHAAALQGRRYEAGLEVWADGLRMSLEEAYWPQCRLRIRSGQWGGRGP